MFFEFKSKFLIFIFFNCLLLSCNPARNFDSYKTPNVSTQALKEIIFSTCLDIETVPKRVQEIPWLLLAVRGIVPYTIDPNTGIKSDQLLPDPEFAIADYFHISPNGEWLAYNIYTFANNSTILIVEPSQNILTNSSRERIVLDIDSSAVVGGWSNNELIFLISGQSMEKFGNTIMLNPFTQEQNEFVFGELPNYLDYQPGMNGSYIFAHSNLMPDSTLKRLVYPAVIENRFTTILWDVENKKELASLRLYLDQWFNDPLWSLDGENFLIMGFDDEEHVEWFQISRNGNIQQVTYLGEFLNDYKIEKPSRSWDGRYLAFQLFYDSGENIKYIILDLKAPALEGFCIDVTSNQGDGAPVWSPDNRYLAITDGDTGVSSQVLLIDIVDQAVFQIGKDADGIGWIPKP